jgi:hypothetical protein
MTVMLERWNDDRMDDLAGKVDEIGVQLHEQHREMRQEMRAQGRELRQEMQAQGRELRQEMLELRRGIKAGAISVSSSAIVGFAALLATQL